MYKSELEVKQALGIESWRNLSKDKVVQFAALMPDMDTEVALKIIEQFPAFKDFAIDAVDSMERSHKATLKANQHSQDRVHDALRHIREILSQQLEKPDLTLEERKFFVEQIQATGRQDASKDSEDKQFLNVILNKVLAGATVAVIAAAAVLGAKSNNREQGHKPIGLIPRWRSLSPERAAEKWLGGTAPWECLDEAVDDLLVILTDDWVEGLLGGGRVEPSAQGVVL